MFCERDVVDAASEMSSKREFAATVPLSDTAEAEDGDESVSEKQGMQIMNVHRRSSIAAELEDTLPILGSFRAVAVERAFVEFHYAPASRRAHFLCFAAAATGAALFFGGFSYVHVDPQWWAPMVAAGCVSLALAVMTFLLCVQKHASGLVLRLVGGRSVLTELLGVVLHTLLLVYPMMVMRKRRYCFLRAMESEELRNRAPHCYNQIDPYVLLSMLSLFVFGWRPVFVIPFQVLIPTLFAAGRTLAMVGRESSYWLNLSFLVTTGVLVSFLSVALDRMSRRHFANFVMAARHTLRSHQTIRDVDQALRALLPEAMLARVESNRPVVDVAPLGTISVCEIFDFARWATTLMPVASVRTVQTLFSMFSHNLGAFGVSELKISGDRFICGTGLDTSATLEDALRVVQYAVAQLSMARHINESLPSPLQLRIGIHTGSFFRAIVGSDMLVYTVFGEAMQEAESVMQMACAGSILVSQSTYALVSGRFTVVPGPRLPKRVAPGCFGQTSHTPPPSRDRDSAATWDRERASDASQLPAPTTHFGGSTSSRRCASVSFVSSNRAAPISPTTSAFGGQLPLPPSVLRSEPRDDVGRTTSTSRGAPAVLPAPAVSPTPAPQPHSATSTAPQRQSGQSVAGLECSALSAGTLPSLLSASSTDSEAFESCGAGQPPEAPGFAAIPGLLETFYITGQFHVPNQPDAGSGPPPMRFPMQQVGISRGAGAMRRRKVVIRLGKVFRDDNDEWTAVARAGGELFDILTKFWRRRRSRHGKREEGGNDSVKSRERFDRIGYPGGTRFSQIFGATESAADLRRHSAPEESEHRARTGAQSPPLDDPCYVHLQPDLSEEDDDVAGGFIVAGVTGGSRSASGISLGGLGISSSAGRQQSPSLPPPHSPEQRLRIAIACRAALFNRDRKIRFGGAVLATPSEQSPMNSQTSAATASMTRGTVQSNPFALIMSTRKYFEGGAAAAVVSNISPRTETNESALQLPGHGHARQAANRSDDSLPEQHSGASASAKTILEMVRDAQRRLRKRLSPGRMLNLEFGDSGIEACYREFSAREQAAISQVVSILILGFAASLFAAVILQNSISNEREHHGALPVALYLTSCCVAAARAWYVKHPLCTSSGIIGNVEIVSLCVLSGLLSSAAFTLQDSVYNGSFVYLNCVFALALSLSFTRVRWIFALLPIFVFACGLNIGLQHVRNNYLDPAIVAAQVILAAMSLMVAFRHEVLHRELFVWETERVLELLLLRESAALQEAMLTLTTPLPQLAKSVLRQFSFLHEDAGNSTPRFPIVLLPIPECVVLELRVHNLHEEALKASACPLEAFRVLDELFLLLDVISSHCTELRRVYNLGDCVRYAGPIPSGDHVCLQSAATTSREGEGLMRNDQGSLSSSLEGGRSASGDEEPAGKAAAAHAELARCSNDGPPPLGLFEEGCSASAAVPGVGEGDGEEAPSRSQSSPRGGNAARFVSFTAPPAQRVESQTSHHDRSRDTGRQKKECNVKNAETRVNTAVRDALFLMANLQHLMEHGVHASALLHEGPAFVTTSGSIHLLSFEVLGVSVRTCAAILAAAPATFIGVSQSALRIVQHVPELRDSFEHLIGPPSHWRVRGVGSVGVHPLVPVNETRSTSSTGII